MLRQKLLKDCIKNLNTLFLRKKSFVIRQIETTKLSKAQRMKKLNYETSYLFGSKNKDAKEVVVQKNDKGSKNDDKGIDSEIYWTTKKKKQPKNEEQIVVSSIEKPKKRVKKTAKKEELPETFAKFKIDLPKPVKITIHDALNNIDAQIKDNPIQQKEIPFDQKQLRSMVQFPLILEKNDLVLDMFNKATFQKMHTPSVSKILQGTMSASQKQALIQWKNLKIAELGIQGFEELQQMYLSRGKKFHECLQKYFTNVQIDEEDVSMDIIEVWESISHVLKDFEKPAVLTEHNLEHPYLLYKGIVDCVAVHRKTNTISVIEWKNSDRYKRSVSATYDAPLQLTAYLAALNATEFRDNPLTDGIIVVAYNDGQAADLFQLSQADIKKYWAVWLNRLQDYWIRYRDNTLQLDEI